MKILLIGEFSGVHNNLADGLKALGHNVFLANNGDGSRNFHGDFRWDISHFENSKLKKIEGIYNIVAHKELFKGYDIVQLISPRYSPSLPYLNKIFVKYLLSNNDKLFWIPSGASAIIDKFWCENDSIRCPAYDFFLEESKNNGYKLDYQKKRYYEYEQWFVEQLDGIIPTMYEYTGPFLHYPNFLRTIPFPINVDKISYKPNIVHDKIIFYHGITRKVKGTEYIDLAFKKMRLKYNEEAEFMCLNKVPFDEYMRIVNKTNVVLDQTNSFSSGMNGLFSLAQGKIVMGGGDPIGFKDLGYGSSPIININSDVDQICNEIEKLMSKKDQIESMGYASRKHIEKHHHYIKVSQMYLDTWSKSK